MSGVFPNASLTEVLAWQTRALWLFAALAPLPLLARFAAPARAARWLHPLSTTLLFAWLLCGVAFYFPHSNDDALIFSRFARNLAGGHGFAFNPGDPVEGFTSPAWLLLLAAASSLGLEPLLAAKLLGALLVIPTALLLHDAVRRLTGDGEVAFACAFALAADALYRSWAASGMDASLFLLWEVALARLFLGTAPPGRGALLLSGAGFWIRPEAYLVAGVAWGLALTSRARARGARALPAPALALLLLAAAPFAARLALFDAWLPNTWTAKSYRTPAQGLAYLGEAALWFGPLLALAAAGLLRLLRRQAWLALVVAGYAGYFVFSGGDVLGLRLALFAWPFLLLGAAGILAWPGWSSGSARRGLLAACCAALALQGGLAMSDSLSRLSFQGGAGYVSSNSIGTFQADYPAALSLARHASPDDLLATDNIGAAGYYGGTRVLDTFGLVDAPMARSIRRGAWSDLRARLLAADPDWILCNLSVADGRERWGLPFVGEITPWAEARYRVAGRWQSATGYARVLLERR